MRTLLYGMQSSGASYVTWCHCQAPNVIGIIDLWIQRRAPLARQFEGQDVVMKATIGTTWPLEDHLCRFEPDRLILVVRNREDNVRSLLEKRYRDSGGTIEEKLAILDRLDPGRFDEVINYEEFATTAPQPTRRLQQIRDYNCKCNRWCRRNFRRGWGFGGIRVHCPTAALTRLPDTPDGKNGFS